MEEDLRKVAPGLFATDANDNKMKGRLDIRYATTGGRHVIVELKRYSVKTDTADLAAQGLKYYTALKSILKKQGREDQEIEIISVVGDMPGTAGAGRLAPKEYIADRFKPFNGRYVLYDQLIENANRQYEDYLNASDKARALDDLLKDLGDTEPPN
jgi:hypothetical protein